MPQTLPVRHRLLQGVDHLLQLPLRYPSGHPGHP
jgi:hypothetical protein